MSFSKKPWRAIASGTLKFALSLSLLYWFVATGRLPLEGLKILADPKILAGGFLLVGITMFLTSERWRCVLRTQGFHASPVPTMRMTLIGVFFNTFMPGGVGGDVVKCYYLVQNLEGQRSRAIATVLYDRVLGLYTWLILAFIACIVEYEILLQNRSVRHLALAICAILFAFTVLFILLWSSRLSLLRDRFLGLFNRESFLGRNLHGLNSFQINKRQLTQIMVISLLGQATCTAFFVWMAPALGFPNVPLAAFMFVIPIGFLATALPISPGGIGVGQMAFFYLFNIVLQRRTEIGSLTITAFQAFNLAYGLIGALLYVFVRDRILLSQQQTLQQQNSAT